MNAYTSKEITDCLLFHSDQGGNYVSKTFMNQLKELNVEQSFSRASTPYDNSVCESFFSNFKQEELYRHEYKSAEEMKRSINRYMVSTMKKDRILFFDTRHRISLRQNITINYGFYRSQLQTTIVRIHKIFYFVFIISLFGKKCTGGNMNFAYKNTQTPYKQ